MKKFIYIMLLGIIPTLSNAQLEMNKTAEQFTREADSMGLHFTMPAGYHPVPVKLHTEVDYLFAIKNDSADFEIRYSVWPLKEAVEKYNRCKADTSCKLRDPNAIYRKHLEDQILAISCGKPQFIAVFPHAVVEKEMKADEGGFVFYKPDSDFSKGYSLIQTVVYHKNDVADVMINFLSNDRKIHEELMLAPFNALTFH